MDRGNSLIQFACPDQTSGFGPVLAAPGGIVLNSVQEAGGSNWPCANFGSGALIQRESGRDFHRHIGDQRRHALPGLSAKATWKCSGGNRASTSRTRSSPSPDIPARRLAAAPQCRRHRGSAGDGRSELELKTRHRAGRRPRLDGAQYRLMRLRAFRIGKDRIVESRRCEAARL